MKSNSQDRVSNPFGQKLLNSFKKILVIFFASYDIKYNFRMASVPIF